MSVESARILVVEDNRDTSALLRDLLEAEGYQVDSAVTGEAAFERLDIEPDVDLLVLDLMLPGMSGYEVLERLRAQPANADSSGPNANERRMSCRPLPRPTIHACRGAWSTCWWPWTSTASARPTSSRCPSPGWTAPWRGA